jgi:thiamine biosynthesis lipoprotein
VSTFSSVGVEVRVSGASSVERRAIECLFAEHDRTFSPFRPDSELSALNRCTGRIVRVSTLFAETLAVALGAARQTCGMVDPTLSRARCGTGRDARYWRPGIWQEIRVRERLVFVPRGVRLDLNGVVKALCVDRAFALLRSGGFVSAGGDLRTHSPLSVSLPGGGVVTLHAGALATSGTTKRGLHLIDARTGRACEGPWREVTASGETCLDADVAAKAGFLAGDGGPLWLDRLAIPARFVALDGNAHPNDAWLSAVPEPVVACS